MDGAPNGGVFAPQNLNLFGYTYNNPVNLVDPDGNWVNVAIGALVGLVAQGASDLYHGELSGWKSYGTAIVAGGVAGATFGAGTATLGAAGAGESVAGGYAVAAAAGATGGTTARVLNGEDVTAGTVAFDATAGMALHGVGRGVGSKLNRGITNKNFPDISTKLSQKQNRHLKGHPQTQASYVKNIDDAKEVLSAFHIGKTKVVGKTKQGFPIINYKGVTGVNVNKGAGYLNQQTNTFIIKGTTKPSIVPTNPK